MPKMENPNNPESGYTLTDLLSQDGITLDVENDMEVLEEDYEFSKNVFMSNDEILKFLNMNDEDVLNENDEYGTKTETPEAVMPCDINFDKLRTKMNDISGNGMVMKLIRREGDGEKVSEGAQVSIKYIGYFEYQDEPFDSSYAHGSGPDQIRLGDNVVIRGLEVGIKTMRKNEISVFLIKAEYAYGPLGCPPRIPPDQEVLFVVYLTDFLEQGAADTLGNLSLEAEKSFPLVKKAGTQLLLKGNENFKREKTRQAIRDYTKVVNMLEKVRLENDEEEEEQKKLLTRAFGNLAVCFNKENKPRNAYAACQKVPLPNAKTYFNFGRALLRLGEFEKAKNYLWKARELEPNNKETLKEIKQADDMHVKYISSEKRLWSNCLKISKEESAKTEFEKAVHELCETFKNNTNLVRQALPDGLTPEDDKCLRQIAKSHGLSFTSHKRYGKEIFYLIKTNY